MLRLERFLEVYEDLGPMEKDVLEIFLERLYAGQKAFGILTLQKRDWIANTLEEAIDASVYISSEMVRLKNMGSGVKHPSEKLALAERELAEF